MSVHAAAKQLKPRFVQGTFFGWNARDVAMTTVARAAPVHSLQVPP